MFPDDDAAEAWIAKVRWPDGPRCPHCDSDNVLTGAAHKTMPYRLPDPRTAASGSRSGSVPSCRTPSSATRLGRWRST